jgi:DNA-binding CsgD family transcriptional regulator
VTKNARNAGPSPLDHVAARPGGRKLKLTPYQRQEALQSGLGEPLIEIARTFGVSHSTISRLAEA